MKKLNTIVTLLLAATLMFSLVSCAKAQTPAATDNAPAATENAPVATEKAPVTLTYWTYYTDRFPLFEQYGKDYEALTGVKVNFELIPGDTLGQKFTAASESGTMPDIVSTWVGIGEGTAPFAKEGKILNLTSYMDDGWGKQFVPALLDSASFAAGNEFGVEPGPYLIPLDANNMQILYNNKLFEQAGITSVPTTFEEFLADGAKLKSIGVAPFVGGFKDWSMSAFASMYYWNFLGAENLEKTYSGEMKYTDQAWVDFLTLFETLGKSDALGTGSVSYDLPAAETLFVNGQAGMIFDGSWAIGVFNSQNPDFKDYGVFFPPAATNAKYPLYIPGGVGAMEFIVGTSPNIEEAVKFMKWMTDAPQQAKYATSSFNLPANINVAGKVPMTDNLTVFSQTMDKTAPKIVHTMKPAVESTMAAGIQRILSGEDTPSHVAELMQKAHETEQVQ